MRVPGQKVDSLIGVLLDDRYEIRGVLGEGGAGTVYEGFHRELERSLAIKVLRPMFATDGDAVERFLREARIVAGFGHANIVDVYDLGRLPDERPYLVMPLLRGRDLDRVLEEGGPQHPLRVAELLHGPAKALDLLHRRGLVHRDVKPSNLIVTEREDGVEEVKLLDFGLAMLTSPGERRLTHAGLVCGTPHYISPEAAGGKVPDARGDVYSLAVVAFELITGKCPFDAPNVLFILSSKVANDAPTLRDVTGRPFPEELEDVFRRGLARDPRARYESASAFVAALRGPAAIPLVDAPFRSEVTGQRPVEEPIEGRPRGEERVAKPGLHRRPPPEREEREETATDPSVGSDRPPQLRTERRPRFESDRPPRTSEPAASGALPMVRRRTGFGILITAAAAVVAAVAMIDFEGTPDTELSEPVRRQSSEARPSVEADLDLEPVAAREPAPAPPDPPAAPEPPAVVEPAAPPSPPAAGALARQPREPRGRREDRRPPAPAPAAPAPAPAPSAAADAPPEVTLPATDRERATALSREATSALVRGMLPRAIELYREATIAAPGYAPAWRGLGLANERMGRRPEAVSAYNRYLRLAPNARDAEQVRGRVTALGGG
jgi:serine/threonine-protein kinase